MFSKSLIALLVLGIGTAPAMAENASREEATGVGIGAVIGGVAGGPAGAIFGAAIGARIGDEFHQKKENISSLSDSLEDSQLRVGTLEQDIRALKGQVAARDVDLREARDLARPELLALLKNKDISLARLRKILFGASTEKTKDVLPEDAKGDRQSAGNGIRVGMPEFTQLGGLGPDDATGIVGTPITTFPRS